ncbi:MAG: cyclic lactone autoinducer peptide [Ruminococcus sp.]|nr:cyclic lactone autoinducer peptide [Ruminococcus sp.]
MKAEKKTSAPALVIKKAAEKMAKIACGAASYWGLHQIKEPKLRK